MPPVKGHEELPADEVVPVAHVIHTLDPAVAANVPAEQEVHEVEAPFPYVPATHGVHPALVALGTQYVPDQQHTVVPEGVHCG